MKIARIAALLFAFSALAQPVPATLPQNVEDEFDRVQQLVSAKRIDEALTAAQRAFDLGTAAHLDAAVRGRLMDEVGMVHITAGRYADAEAAYRRALELRESGGNLNDPDIAWTLNGLASALVALGRTRDAEPVSRRALALLDATATPDDLTLMNALTNGVLIAIALDKDEDVKRLQQRMNEYTLRMARQLNPSAPTPPPDDEMGISVLADFLDDPEQPIEARLVMRTTSAVQAEARLDHAAVQKLLRKALEESITETGDNSPATACTLNALAGAWLLYGRFDDADELYRSAASALHGPREHALDLAYAELGIARAAAARCRGREVRTAYEKALATLITAVTDNHPFIPMVLWEMSQLDDSAIDAKDRARLTQRARALYDRITPFREGRTMPMERVHAMLFGYQRIQEVTDCASRLYAARMEADLAPGNRLQLATNLYQGGTAYFLYGAGSQAIPKLLDALRFFRESLGDSHPYVLNVLRDLTFAELQAKQFTPGLKHAREATAMVDVRLGANSEPDELLREQALQRAVYLNHLDLLFESRRDVDGAESFTLAQRARASSTALTLHAATARAAARNPQVAALIRDFQDRARHHRKLGGDLLAAAGLPAQQRDLAAESQFRRERAMDEESMTGLRAQIEQAAPAYAETVFPRPLSLDETRALLHADEALLALVSGPRFTYAWLVRRNRVDAMRLPPQRRDWDEIVARLRRALDVADIRQQYLRNAARLTFDVDTAAQIYRELFAPFETRLSGVRHLLIVPDGPLETVPFAALVTKPTPAAMPLSEVPWLIRRFAISVIPSVASLKSLRAQPRTNAPLAFVGFGNPSRGIASSSASDVDRIRLLREQSDLQETRIELSTMAASLHAETSALHFGPDASEGAVKSLPLSRYRVVAFSTHASLGGTTEPSLLLAPSESEDGRLTTSEIATLSLDADLVLLLGCDTAAADGTPDAEGFSGLTRAFLYAGSRAVLVSHWSIPSEQTVVLVAAMFDDTCDSNTRGMAHVLRRAMLRLIESPDRPELAHPVYWAPFALVGDGRRELR
jgi:CHAT domain-containing protein